MFENYLARKNDPEQRVFSEPIIVEGFSYELTFNANGDGAGKKTHISVGAYRRRLQCLNLDKNDKVLTVIKMVHSTNRQKDFERESIEDFELEGIYDWTGLNETSLVCDKFYAIADLKKDGFIHPDGSLRFEYKVGKRNL